MIDTKTPWKITPHANGLSSVDIGDSGIIITLKTDDAHLIVTAVNSHAQLVEALRLNLIEQERTSLHIGTAVTPGMLLARAALRAAGKLNKE